MKTKEKCIHIYKTAIQKHISYINHVLCFADFATMSKRLGELWATVPTNEKYVSPCMYLSAHIQDCIQKFHYNYTDPVIF